MCVASAAWSLPLLKDLWLGHVSCRQAISSGGSSQWGRGLLGTLAVFGAEGKDSGSSRIPSGAMRGLLSAWGGGLSCSKIWPRVGVQEGLVLGFLPLFSGRAESPWCFLSLEGSRPVSIQQTPELSLSLPVALSAIGLACPICWHPVCPWGSALPLVPGTSLCAVCEPSSRGP